ncbi:CD1375 family protein [Clostridium algidicarnis]|nr:CD1375 family protein [Clostridium algidicarnis]
MVVLYVRLIGEGRLKLEDVPKLWNADVKKVLEQQ